MALTFGNMDQQVQQQADVFSNNPAALQQRYQQSQQLLDLLALQKIKSDKEAAAREMQMQMEQRPQTIAQQREAEVMGLTKDELAKQMGGIMAQRQSAEQSNIKRAAAGQPPGQRMAMAPPPQMGGVAGQPAPNMVNMAQGGVVGFQPGGEVGTPIQTLLKELEISEAVYNSRPELKAKIDAILKGRGEGSQFGRDVGDPAALRRALSAEADKARKERPLPGAETASYLFGTQRGLTDLETRNAAAREKENLFRGAAQRSGAALSSLSPPPNAAPNAAPNAQPGLPGSFAGLDASALMSARPAAPAQAQAQAQAPAALAAPQLAAPATASSKLAGVTTTMPAGDRATYRDPSKTTEGIALAKDRARILKGTEKSMGRNLVEEQAARQAGVGSLLRRDERRDMYDKLMADREALKKRQAEARAQRGPLAGLLASPRAGSSAFGRIGQDLYRDQERRFGEEQRDLNYLYQMAKDRETADMEAGKSQVTAGTAARGYAEADIQNARRDASSLLRDRGNDLSDIAKGYLNADTANMTAEAALRADRVKMAVSEADNSVKTAVANLESKIQTERNVIEREKISGMSIDRKQKLFGTVSNMIAKVRTDYDKIKENAATAALMVPPINKLEGKARDAALANIRKKYNTMRDASAGDLQKFADKLMDSISGGGDEFTVRR
jgi:hypothetical protein